MQPDRRCLGIDPIAKQIQDLGAGKKKEAVDPRAVVLVLHTGCGNALYEVALRKQEDQHCWQDDQSSSSHNYWGRGVVATLDIGQTLSYNVIVFALDRHQWPNERIPSI